MTFEYYRERHGVRNPTVEEIGVRFWRGFGELTQWLLQEGYLIDNFPVECEDRTGVVATDIERLKVKMLAEIDVSFPLPLGVPKILEIMEVIEFLGLNVSKPNSKEYHDYMRHYHYGNFDRAEGFREYSERINRLLRRCGHPYQLKPDGRMEHIGPDALHTTLQGATFQTGDQALDTLLEEARTRFLSPDPIVRRDSLEKLWDAWERLKTIEVPADKRRSIEQLLNRAVNNTDLKTKLDSECRELTEIGNTYRIRHHEVGKIEIVDNSDVDYLFYRLFGLIYRLLKGTGRVV